MFSTIIQRKILWDLTRIFAITLVGLTGLFLLGGMVAEASQHGLAPGQLIRLLPLMIPGMLPYTIPAATLFATCNVYGRLAKDNEITALRAAGISLFPVLLPSLLLGIAGCAMTAGLYYQLIPRSFRLVREHLTNQPTELLYMMLKRSGCIKNNKLPYVLFAREVRGQRLLDAIFKRRMKVEGGYDGYDTVARASDATLRVIPTRDPATGALSNEIVVTMNNCTLWNEAKKGSAPATMMVRSQIYRERLPPDAFGESDVPRSCDVSWPELLVRTPALRERERKTDEEIRPYADRLNSLTALYRSQGMDEGRIKDLTAEDRKLLEYKRNCQRLTLRQFHSFEAEVQMRPALAIGCLCFVLIGGPIGIWTNRADFLSSFVIGFLPAVMLYYPILLCGTNLGKDGKVPMPIAVWTADAIFLVIAIGMCWRVVRR